MRTAPPIAAHRAAERKYGSRKGAAQFCAALRRGGAFVLTDYMEEDEEASRAAFCEKARLLAGREGLYHIDTPLTVRRERQALLAGGFARVREEGRWGKTSLLVAERD